MLKDKNESNDPGNKTATIFVYLPLEKPVFLYILKLGSKRN